MKKPKPRRNSIGPQEPGLPSLPAALAERLIRYGIEAIMPVAPDVVSIRLDVPAGGVVLARSARDWEACWRQVASLFEELESRGLAPAEIVLAAGSGDRPLEGRYDLKRVLETVPRGGWIAVIDADRLARNSVTLARLRRELARRRVRVLFRGERL